jgi:asparagine synthase (glutamine-hydrolysing)
LAALAAVFSSSTKNQIHETVALMLEVMKHRAGDGSWVVTDGCLKANPSLESSWALGFGFKRVLHKDVPQLFKSDRFALALDGRIYDSKSEPDIEFAAKTIKGEINLRTMRRFLETVSGQYSCIVATRSAMYAFRDRIGLRPLYYARASKGIVIASERKAMWRIGVNTPRVFPPGSVGLITPSGILSSSMPRFMEKPLHYTSILEAAEVLELLLRRAIASVTRDVRDVSVAFSGGLDSGIVALLAQQLGLKVRLVTVGVEGIGQTNAIEKAAADIGLELIMNLHSSDEVEESLRRILWLIEEPSLMKVGVAIPLYWAAKLSISHGYRVMLTGQGADELYGGYKKFADILLRCGAEAAEQAIRTSIENAHSVNYVRDEQVCAPLGVEPRSPFAHPEIIRHALSTPLSMKILSPNDELRKQVLRVVARRIGLPEYVSTSKKKAIQHSTGVDRIIRRLAKKYALRPDALIDRIFIEVRNLPKMP